MQLLRFASCTTMALLVNSASAATSVQGSLVRDVAAKPGQTVQVSVTLHNTGNTEESVRISVEDVRVQPGNTTYFKAGQQDRSNALWVKLPAAALTLPANSTKLVNVSITVPQNAAPGAHWSALIVQPDRLPSPSKGGVIVNTRYAVNLITTLPGGAPKVRFANPSLQRKADGVHLGVKVFNDGTATTVPQYRAEVYNTQGKLVARDDVAKMRLYPGGGVQVDFSFGKLTAGKYTFVVMANDGVNPVVGTRYTVNVEN
ncbi:Fn3-like domain-containing protein [Deinococcus hohokamensis]|uniref:Fn3-like domain-containing protein n=1 Tax=Deinococcus hohokamensis TaxID=309883 RepID=A0ABV9I9N6_9DEIO